MFCTKTELIFVYNAKCYTMSAHCAILNTGIISPIPLKSLKTPRKVGDYFVKINIGLKIKTLRKGRGLTQEQLAEKLGITRATVSNYEVGRRAPHISELRRIADFFGVGVDYFGVIPTDEAFDLLSRAREVFQNEDIPREKKEELYKSLMRIYLDMR